MICGADVKPPESTLDSHFQFPTMGNTNMADEVTCDVGSTPVLYNDVNYRFSGKTAQ
jgi:hypothetical protein